MIRELQSLGTIKNGKLSIHYRNEFVENLSMFNEGNESCRIKIIIKKLYRKRSNNQNAYYWACVINEFCNGYKELNSERITKEQAHEFLKNEFLFKEFVNKETGEIKRIPLSTSILTTVEFMEFNECCVKFILEWFGIKIEPPGKQTEFKL